MTAPAITVGGTAMGSRADDVLSAVTAGLSDDDLAALGVCNQDTAAENAFARVLALGPAKAGKTTCIASGAPKPLIINCDGQGATKGAANQGAEFLTIDVTNRATWRNACAVAGKLVVAGNVESVIVDTASLLSDSILDEVSVTLQGWDIWTELCNSVMKGINALRKLDAHLFVTCHMTPDKEGTAGILPSIGGKLKVRLPAVLDDWILLDVEAGRKPHERMWILGPQKTWNHSGRNIKRSTMVEASVPALFAELGINL